MDEEVIRVPLTAMDIEVICDALWFVEREQGMDEQERVVWEKLQPLRRPEAAGDDG